MTDIKALHDFIVTAKAATYVGGGDPAPPCRMGSHDLQFEQGDFRYLDSYFGGADFIGQEVVYEKDTPVWAMNYYGRLLKPKKITAAEAGAMIKASLSQMYADGRFLGGWDHALNDLVYHDRSEGDLTNFKGFEWIKKSGQKVYELIYHGGLIR